MIKDFIARNRSCRRFIQSHKIESALLEELVDYARLSPSAGNLQRLRFRIVNSEKENEKVFSTLSWAGYLTDWNGPEDGEKPSAYIVILTTENDISKIGCDAGIACQSILLGAVEENLRGCIFGSVNRKILRAKMFIPQDLKIIYVIALGKPNERVAIEKVVDDNIKYWRDENGVHHVPKRNLEDLIIK